MTNATKTLAIIFAGTLALAFATSWSWSGSSSAAFQKKLLAVDSSAVRGLRIERPGGPSVHLQKSADGGWTVGPSDGSASYPARTSSVERLLNTLPSLQVNAVATRQTDKYPRYGVDSTGTTVTVLGSGEEELGSLVVGRTEFRSRNNNQQKQSPMQRMRRQGTSVTYVRSPDRSDVYSVKASLESLLNKDVTGWRDKTIWGIAESDIQRIRLTTTGDSTAADSSFRLQRAVPSDTASVSQATWISDGDTLSTDAVSPVVRTVASPRADGFATTTDPNSLTDPKHTVRLRLTDGSTRTLNFYTDPSGDTYLVTASDYPYAARVQARRWDDVFKPRSEFLPSGK